MTTAPDIKYNQRDIREDPRLHDAAVEYIKAYGGDFEPLTMAQQELEDHGKLDSLTVQKVLNCARHDKDWKDQLPVPKRRIPPVTDPFAVPNRKKKHWSEDYEKQCKKNKDPHDGHSWEDSKKSLHWCKGIAFKVDRPYAIRMATRVKLPYAAARQGKMIHMTEGTAYVEWHPQPHDWGFRHPERYRFQVPDDRTWNIVVKVRCKNPHNIKNPVLLSNDELVAYMANVQKLRNPDIKICPRCLPTLNG